MAKIRRFTPDEMRGRGSGTGGHGAKFAAALALKVGEGMEWDASHPAASHMARKLSKADDRVYITRTIDGVLYLICAADRTTQVPAGGSPRRAVRRPRGR